MARVTPDVAWARFIDEPSRGMGRGGGCLTAFDERALADIHPGYHGFSDVVKLRLAREAILSGVVSVKSTGWSPNTWTNALIEAIWTTAKTAAPFQVTHVEIGTGTGTPDRADTTLFAGLSPRKPVTDIIIEGEFLKTSSYVGALDYYQVPNLTLREGGLRNALTGGSLWNHLMWSAPLVKGNQACLADITLQLTPA